MGKIIWHPVTRRLVEIEARLRMLEERVDAQSLVIGWLLARQPGDDAMTFLSCQANELEHPDKYVETVALLDELRDDLAQWHVQWSSGSNKRD